LRFEAFDEVRNIATISKTNGNFSQQNASLPEVVGLQQIQQLLILLFLTFPIILCSLCTQIYFPFFHPASLEAFIAIWGIPDPLEKFS
jgi:hypothetical protein